MPPKIKITKQAIVETALDIVRHKGVDALNARAIAKELNCSTQPIFSNFPTMTELKEKVIKAASERYHQYTVQKMESSAYPAYKASGMAYIQFAKEERNLFRLLFMRDRTKEKIEDDTKLTEPIIHLISSRTGMSYAQANRFHLSMWIYVHGIATMIATSYLDWNEDVTSEMLTDVYQGLLKQYQIKLP